MGQPIVLVKGNEQMTVYGRHQAAIHVAEGWQYADVRDQLQAPVIPVKPINATDKAIMLANARGVDLNSIKGSGQNGRILLKDVMAALNS